MDDRFDELIDAQAEAEAYGLGYDLDRDERVIALMAWSIGEITRLREAFGGKGA